jgi:excinuclease ABC subunit A
MEKPDVDRIEGIAPAIAIRQKNSVRNPRSTVGTVTEVHDYMRLLFARVGRTFCTTCGVEVVRETAEVVADRLLALPAGTRLLIGFDMPVFTRQRCRTRKPIDDYGDDAAVAMIARPRCPPRQGPAFAGRAADESPAQRGFGRLLVDGRAVASKT